MLPPEKKEYPLFVFRWVGVRIQRYISGYEENASVGILLEAGSLI